MVAMATKKKLHTIVTSKDTIIDHETGEVIKENINYKRILLKTKEDFFYTYSSVIGLYKDLSGAEIKILSWLMLNQSNLGNNLIIINKYVKEKISIDMGISIYTVKNSVKPLVEKGFLIKEGSMRSGTYLINPEYYWKGDYASRTKTLRLMLEVKLDGEMKPNEDFDKIEKDGDKIEDKIEKDNFEEISKLKF